MTTRPALAGYGVGYCIFFCFLAGPGQRDPLRSERRSSTTRLRWCCRCWCRRLRSRCCCRRRRRGCATGCWCDLRRQVVLASRAGLRRVRSRFESGARDLMFQINALAPNEPELQRDTLRWLFSVLEVGNAVIDLRREIAALPARRALREVDAVARVAARDARCADRAVRTAARGPLRRARSRRPPTRSPRVQQMLADLHAAARGAASAATHSESTAFHSYRAARSAIAA